MSKINLSCTQTLVYNDGTILTVCATETSKTIKYVLPNGDWREQQYNINGACIKDSICRAGKIVLLKEDGAKTIVNIDSKNTKIPAKIKNDLERMENDMKPFDFEANCKSLTRTAEYTDGKNIYTVIYSQKVGNKHSIRTDEQAIINGTEYAINIIPGPNTTSTMAKAKEYRDKTSCVDPLKDLTRSYPTPTRTIFAKNVMKNHIAVR